MNLRETIDHQLDRCFLININLSSSLKNTLLVDSFEKLLNKTHNVLGALGVDVTPTKRSLKHLNSIRQIMKQSKAIAEKNDVLCLNLSKLQRKYYVEDVAFKSEFIAQPDRRKQNEYNAPTELWRPAQDDMVDLNVINIKSKKISLNFRITPSTAHA